MKEKIWANMTAKQKIIALQQAKDEICTPPVGMSKEMWNFCTHYFKEKGLARAAHIEGGEVEAIQLTNMGAVLLSQMQSDGINTKDAQSFNPEPQQEQPKKTRGRGRPKETLKDKMIDDADGSKLQKMHTKIVGKKGKDVALIILACIKKGWMTKPTYTHVKNEFGDIGSKTGYNRYLNEQMFIKEELEGAINSLD